MNLSYHLKYRLVMKLMQDSCFKNNETYFTYSYNNLALSLTFQIWITEFVFGKLKNLFNSTLSLYQCNDKVATN